MRKIDESDYSRFFQNLNKDISLPLFGLICRKHHESLIRNNEENIADVDSDFECSIEDEILVKDKKEMHGYSVEKKSSMNNILNALSVKPIVFQVHKPICNLKSRRIRDIKRHYENAKTEFNFQYFEAVAPYQGKILQYAVENNSKIQNENVIDLNQYAQMYKMCWSNEAKLCLLSTIPSEQFSKAQIIAAIPEVTKYKISVARKQYHSNKKDEFTDEIVNVRLDEKKSEHFLEFAFGSGSIQQINKDSMLFINFSEFLTKHLKLQKQC